MCVCVWSQEPNKKEYRRAMNPANVMHYVFFLFLPFEAVLAGSVFFVFFFKFI